MSTVDLLCHANYVVTLFVLLIAGCASAAAADECKSKTPAESRRIVTVDGEIDTGWLRRSTTTARTKRDDTWFLSQCHRQRLLDQWHHAILGGGGFGKFCIGAPTVWKETTDLAEKY